MRMNRTWKQALFAYVNLGKKRVKSKTKEGSFMKKKWMESALAVTLACTMFAGCGQSAQTTADGESVSADLAGIRHGDGSRWNGSGSRQREGDTDRMGRGGKFSGAAGDDRQF